VRVGNKLECFIGFFFGEIKAIRGGNLDDYAE
jgi:hypothetical protein